MKNEIYKRIENLRKKLNNIDENWEMVLITNKINLFYLTNTMADGVLVISPDDAVFYVRRTYERAVLESPIDNILSMKSFRDIKVEMVKIAYIETKTITLDYLAMIRKYIDFSEYKSIDKIMMELRSVKSDYELNCMIEAGKIADKVYSEIDTMLYEGISEAVLSAEIFKRTLALGSMGVARTNNKLGDEVIGTVTFSGENLLPMAFESANVIVGTSKASQIIGSNNVLLKENTSILIDIPTGIEGYLCDKSETFFYKVPMDSIEREAYEVCKKLEVEAASMLAKSYNLGETYNYIENLVPNKFKTGFMSGSKFIGHSIGLTLDETPVIAPSFGEIEDNMVFAIEPKIKIDGIGVVGTENTYIIKENKYIKL